MNMKFDRETGKLTIGEKYEIEPLMPIDEIKKSSILELMDEESKEWLYKDPTMPIFLRADVNGQKVTIELEILKCLSSISIKLNSKKMSEAYYSNDTDKINEIAKENKDFTSRVFGSVKNDDNYEWGYVKFKESNKMSNVETVINYYI